MRVDHVESVHMHVYNKYIEYYRGKGYASIGADLGIEQDGSE